MESHFQSPSEIANYLNCERLTAQLLWSRGYRTVQAVEQLYNTDLANLPSPQTIVDLPKAAARIADALERKEPIAVYGDYDVDGTCGASIFFDFFRQLGSTARVYQPNRFSEGYGVHSAAIRNLIKGEGHRIVITVDCGITAVEPARVAKELGADLIIVDHHKCGESLPEAFAVVDPQRPDDMSGLKTICGAGLAFFLIMAVRAELRNRDFFVRTGLREPNLLRFLDLVAVATVADVMDLRGVNRTLVTHGLKILRTNPRPGLRAILAAAGIEKPTAMTCGFVIGPRINAAGRLKSAKTSFELLTTEDYGSALEFAQELEKFNLQRRETQNAVFESARQQALEILAQPLPSDLPSAVAGPWPRALVLANPEWHEGVVGIVASKLVEEFSRPVFVLTESEQRPGAFKGSIRSIAKIDILSVISAQSVAQFLLNYGGHAHAGGVTLERERLEDFTRALNEHLSITTDQSHFTREKFFDVDAVASDITEKFLVEMDALEPFGHQFPEPVLRLAAVDVQSFKVLKEKHVKLRVTGPRGVGVDAIWFNAFAKDPDLSPETVSSRALFVTPQWNEWQGMRRLQLKVHQSDLI